MAETTEITVNATKQVASVYVELGYGQESRVQGIVQVLLTVPPQINPLVAGPVPAGYETQSTIASSYQTIRKMTDVDPGVLDAIEILTQAVLEWEEEDKLPSPPPEEDPTPPE